MGIETNAEIGAFDAGVDAADNAANDPALIQEKALVKQWLERIDESREHDAQAYKQLAIDRRYARGDSPFRTHIPIISCYIDTWVSLLYAKDPDVDFKQSEAVSPMGTDDARMVGKGLAIVVAGLLKKAKLKAQARPWARASLTSHVGWLKAAWLERTASDPVTQRAINDIQDNLASIMRQMEDLREKGQPCGDYEARAEALRIAIEGLESKTEATIHKGLVLDPVDAADITVSMDAPSVNRYLDSPWISHRVYMRADEAIARFKAIPQKDIRRCATYSKRKPIARKDESPATADVNAEEASSFDANAAMRAAGKGGFVCIEEVWDRDAGMVITLMRGLERYPTPPAAPNPGTSRFYPFFGLFFSDVDGERWPQSLNQRSQSLQDAFDRTTDALEEHRSRIKPKLAFNADAIAATEMAKITNGETMEHIGLEGLDPKMDIRKLLTPLVYAQLDPAVYATDGLIAGFERIWGLQEAMTASIDTAKTATEAELQQSGTNARTGDKRDRFEDELTDLAQYVAEIALQKLEREDAVQLAGNQVMWPGPTTIELLDQVGTVQIRAGSSGKPNSRQQREAWAALLPLIEGLIDKIAMLRQSNPLEIADKLEELLVETAARSGDALDPIRFLPQVGQPAILADPTTGQPVAAYPAAQQPGQEPAPAAGGPTEPPKPSSPGQGDPAAPMPQEG